MWFVIGGCAALILVAWLITLQLAVGDLRRELRAEKKWRHEAGVVGDGRYYDLCQKWDELEERVKSIFAHLGYSPGDEASIEIEGRTIEERLKDLCEHRKAAVTLHGYLTSMCNNLERSVRVISDQIGAAPKDGLETIWELIELYGRDVAAITDRLGATPSEGEGAEQRTIEERLLCLERVEHVGLADLNAVRTSTGDVLKEIKQGIEAAMKENGEIAEHVEARVQAAVDELKARTEALDAEIEQIIDVVNDHDEALRLVSVQGRVIAPPKERLKRASEAQA